MKKMKKMKKIKKRWMLLTLLCVLCLTACGADVPPAGDAETPLSGSTAVQPEVPEDTPEEIPEEAPEVHTLSEGGNVIEHEPAGYCGNTVTTVTGPDGESFSFWGDDSVALTDLLRYLNYNEGLCRCQPEYTVDTEFNEGYGVNITEAYARYDGSQTALTAEQVELIREIIDRQSGGASESVPNETGF